MRLIRFERVLTMALVACLAVVSGFDSASGQGSPPMSTTTARLAIASDLKLGITYAQQVIGMVESAGGPEELRRADDLTIRAYLQWNKAVAGVQLLQSRSTFPDPLLAHVTAIINKARETIAGAHTYIGGAAAYEAGRAESIAKALGYLNDAIALAQRAAELVTI